MAKQAEKGARGSISDDRDRRGARGHRDRVEVPAGWKKWSSGIFPAVALRKFSESDRPDRRRRHRD